MIKQTVKNYVIGQDPADAGTHRFAVEMPVGAKVLGAFPTETGEIVISAIVPPQGVSVKHGIAVISVGEKIEMMIGEQFGDVIESVPIPSQNGFIILHILPLLPWPTSSLLDS